MASNSPAPEASSMPASASVSASTAAAAPTSAGYATTASLPPRRGRPPLSSLHHRRNSPASRFRPPTHYNISPSPVPGFASNNWSGNVPSAMATRQGSMPFVQPQQMTSYGQQQTAYPATPTPSIPAPPPDDPRGGISLPSPGPDHSIANPKFRDDYLRIFFAIQQSLPESARAAIRENWQKVLLGSVFNQGFILNAMVCNVEPDVARQSMKDFGSRLIGVAKNELMEHLTTADIDSLTDVILAKASDRFLDAALKKRLPTIDAKPLINALARAARLGYEPDDIEEDSTETSTAAPAAAPVITAPPAPSIKRQCGLCNRIFTGETPFNYHVSNRICWQMAPPQQGFRFACQDCGQGFVDAGSQIYHQNTRACTTTAAAAPPPPQPPQPLQPVAQVHSISSSTPVGQDPQPSGQAAAAESAASAYTSAAKAAMAHEGGAVEAVEEPAVHTPARQQTPGETSQPSADQTTPLAIPRKTTSEAYAHLSEEKLEKLNQELLKVEKAFGPRFQEAELIEDPTERMQRLEGLKNSFGTRQSIVRKKFGVRLRERRTKAEILAEKERMGISPKPHGNSVYVTKRVRYGDYSHRRSTSSDVDDTEDQRKRKTPSNAYTPWSGGVSYPDNGSVTVTRGTSTTSDGPATAAAEPASMVAEENNMSDSSSDDDDDIPALLPDDVMQSLSNR